MKVTGFSRVSKDLIIGQIEKEIKSASTFFVTQYGTASGISMDQLRAKLRTTNARFLVVKNSLGKKAFAKANMSYISESVTGACGIAFTGGDPVMTSKILTDFAKANESFKIKTGFMNGQVIAPSEIHILANLPPKEVLIAKALRGMKAPLSRLVSVLSGTARKIVTVLDAIAKKKTET